MQAATIVPQAPLPAGAVRVRHDGAAFGDSGARRSESPADTPQGGFLALLQGQTRGDTEPDSDAGSPNSSGPFRSEKSRARTTDSRSRAADSDRQKPESHLNSRPGQPGTPVPPPRPVVEKLVAVVDTGVLVDADGLSNIAVGAGIASTTDVVATGVEKAIPIDLGDLDLTIEPSVQAADSPMARQVAPAADFDTDNRNLTAGPPISPGSADQRRIDTPPSTEQETLPTQQRTSLASRSGKQRTQPARQKAFLAATPSRHQAVPPQNDISANANSSTTPQAVSPAIEQFRRDAASLISSNSLDHSDQIPEPKEIIFEKTFQDKGLAVHADAHGTAHPGPSRASVSDVADSISGRQKASDSEEPHDGPRFVHVSTTADTTTEPDPTNPQSENPVEKPQTQAVSARSEPASQASNAPSERARNSRAAASGEVGPTPRLSSPVGGTEDQTPVDRSTVRSRLAGPTDEADTDLDALVEQAHPRTSVSQRTRLYKHGLGHEGNIKTADVAAFAPATPSQPVPPLSRSTIGHAHAPGETTPGSPATDEATVQSVRIVATQPRPQPAADLEVYRLHLAAEAGISNESRSTFEGVPQVPGSQSAAMISTGHPQPVDNDDQKAAAAQRAIQSSDLKATRITQKPNTGLDPVLQPEKPVSERPDLAATPAALDGARQTPSPLGGPVIWLNPSQGSTNPVVRRTAADTSNPEVVAALRSNPEISPQSPVASLAPDPPRAPLPAGAASQMTEPVPARAAAVHTALLDKSSEQQALQVQIQDEKLGRVVVRLTERAGLIDAMVRTDGTRTREFLAQQLPLLVESLARRGFGIRHDGLSIDQNSRESFDQDGQPPRREQHTRRQRRDQKARPAFRVRLN